MSVPYGGSPAGSYPPMSGGGYAPPGRVNFGWINESFDLFKANSGTWVLAVLAFFFVPALIGFVVGLVFGVANAAAGSAGSLNSGAFGGGLPIGVNLLIQTLSLVYRAFISGGVYHMAVKQVRGELISPSDLFSGGRYFLPMLAFSLVYGIAIVVGFVFLIVPGLLVVSLMMPAYALLGDGVSFSEAISRSINGMKQDMWNGIAFLFVLGLLLLVSAIPCGLGLFVTYPMFWLVSALAYRDMIGMPGSDQAFPGYGAPSTPGVWPPAPGTWPPPPNAAPPPWGAPPVSPSQTPQQYPGVPPQSSPPQTSPPQSPNFPPQQYSPPPAQEYPSEAPTLYPPVEPEKPTGETPPNPWQPRPSLPPPSSQGE